MRWTDLVRYVLRRVALAFVLVFVVSSGALWLAHLAPGDAATDLIRPGVSPQTVARERARLGLDRPFAAQYLDWIGRAVRFDLGESVRYGRPVTELVGARAANTALLALVALVVATAIGLGFGIVAGSRGGRGVATVIGAGSIAVLSVPPLLASLLLALVAARTGWFPVGGMTTPGLEAAGWLARAADTGWHLVLPVLALALPLGATIERLQSKALGETLQEPFIRAAISRGLPRRRILWRHAMPVALRPVIGVYGIIIGSLLSGSFVVEIVSAWPGLGRLMYDALLARDVHLVAGCVLAGAVFLAVGTLLSDLALVASDPRLRSES